MKKIILSLVSILLLTAIPAVAEDSCDLARTVAKKGAAAFEKDKATGLKLFIKARELCADDPVYTYNLGMAYYQYGHLDKAQPLLEEAITKKSTVASWLNNLAVLILERGGNSSSSLSYAETAAKTDTGNTAIQETVARARMAAGERLAALKGLRDALGDTRNETLTKAYTTILDGYLTYYIGQIKEGKAAAGITGLKAADFEPKAQRAAALAILQTGKGEDALAFAGQIASRFPNDADVVGTLGDIAATVARSLYTEFQSGKGTQAVQRAKKLSSTYPAAKPLAEAYDKLLEALLADASTIDVPQQLALKQSNLEGGGADALLSSLKTGTGSSNEVDLRVDVDEAIPRGIKAAPNDVAVVIGNRNYEASGSPNVEYAQRDARVVKEYLIKTMGFDAKNILYEENATLSKFRELFGTEQDYRGKLARFVKNGVSRVFVYYVGHGAPDLESTEAYFVPVDANPQYIKANGYRLQTFYDNLSRIPAKGMTVVLDSCFSGNSEKGTLFKNISPALVKVKKEFNGPPNAVVITSAAMDQVSSWYPEKRHSLFTYYFLKGLRGEADPNGKGMITVGGMRKYLQDNVPYMARRITGNEQLPMVTGSDNHILAEVK